MFQTLKVVKLSSQIGIQKVLKRFQITFQRPVSADIVSVTMVVLLLVVAMFAVLIIVALTTNSIVSVI